MHTLEEQVDIYNMFHDGTITALVRDGNSINFEIEIPYLADLINPTFSSFKGKLIGCTEFWYKECGEDSTPITELTFIEKLNLGILDAKLSTEGSIEISCWNTGLGGNLIVKADDILIYDQSNQIVDYIALQALCHKYWSSF